MEPHPLFDPAFDEMLEKQLEKLFSDVVFPSTPPTLVSASPRPWHRLKWSTVFFSVLAVLFISTVILNTGTIIARPNTSPDDGQTVEAIAANPYPFTPTPTATYLAIAEPTPSLSQTPLPTYSPTPSAATSGAQTSAAHVADLRSSPTATIQRTLQSVSERQTSTPTETPTVIASPQPVVSATVTPAPAYALGLDQIPTPVPLIPMPDQAINIVLMGSDQRPYETQWRTDVVIVVSVDPAQPSVSMLTIPRDTWLYIPNWTYQRINLADTHGSIVGYPGGGPGLIKAVIEYNFGIHIDYYARVNFAGLIHIVDALGGIDVLLDCPVEDGFPDDPITEDPSVVTQISYTDPGLYHVDGKHALWLARSRYTTSEFARSRRQHRILQAIWNKANELGFITRLPELWDELTSTVETDLSLEDVVWLASIGLQLDPSQIHSGFIDGRYLSAWTSPGGASVLLPHTEKILEALEPLFNPYPFKAPQGFSRVEVWNGSGHSGWGYLAADALARNGFEVVAVETADEIHSQSVVLDFTTSSKGSPLPLLQSLFNAQVAHVAAEGGSQAPFRLIVGADYQPCQWPTLAQRQPTPTPSSP